MVFFFTKALKGNKMEVKLFVGFFAKKRISGLKERVSLIILRQSPVNKVNFADKLQAVSYFIPVLYEN